MKIKNKIILFVLVPILGLLSQCNNTFAASSCEGSLSLRGASSCSCSAFNQAALAYLLGGSESAVKSAYDDVHYCLASYKGESYDPNGINGYSGIDISGSSVIVSCYNGQSWTVSGGACTNCNPPCPDPCSYISSWIPDWSTCEPVSITDCKTECTQTNPWKEVCTAWPLTYHPQSCTCGTPPNTYSCDCSYSSCDNLPPDAPKPDPETKTKTGTIAGCTFNATCGTADGYEFSSSDSPWGLKTLCELGLPVPSIPDLPTSLTPASWYCNNNGVISDQCTATMSSIPERYCGDSEVQTPNDDGKNECCDDGNSLNEDLCSNECDCNSSGYCGDGQKVASEECEDGNNTSGDGCSSICTIEGGGSYCGDGDIDSGETCDDGNNINGDNCSSICTIETGGSYCGDGDTDSGETCDDGNNTSGDGCSSICIIEGGGGYCGDGDIDSGETCDDGGNLSGDGCSSTCTVEPGGGYCGDGGVQSPNGETPQINEACDDGNSINNDACTNICTEQPEGQPGENAFCGDGIVQSPNFYGIVEACDDGNINNDDECTNNCTDPHTSQPGEGIIMADTTCGNLLALEAYANNLDINTIYATITVNGGLEGGKDMLDLGTPSNFVDLSNNLLDRVYKKGNSSLTFTPIHIDWNPNNGATQVLPIATVTSKTPFKSCGNKLSFKLGGQTIVLNNVGYNFKKPYIGELTSTGNISLGTNRTYKLSAIPQISGFSNYAIGLGKNNISYYGPNITLQDTKLLFYPGALSRNFETRINSSIYATSLNNDPGIQVKDSIISYEMGSETVRYYLSAYDYGNDRTPVKLEGKNFIGIKIIGGLQGAGKYEFTGQGKNISNLYPSNLRTEVRKRAYDYIKNMTSGDIVSNVKYVEGDITISGDVPDTNSDGIPDYETLVVKDGNVTISGNLNPSNKKFGIIVLQDNYKVTSGYNHKGNIFVLPDVTEINAIIYADGGLMSADSNGKVYTVDSAIRTYALQKQLTMNGTLFTRNTIGGAQYGGTKNGGIYILPGGTKTASYDKAMVYDLNYLRRGNVGCDDINDDTDCDDEEDGEIKEGFIIKYDSRIQTNPPKIFSK